MGPSRIRDEIATPSPSTVHANSTATATATRSSTRRVRPSSGARAGGAAGAGSGAPPRVTAPRLRTDSSGDASSRGLPTHAMSLIGSQAPAPSATRSPLVRTAMVERNRPNSAYTHRNPQAWGERRAARRGSVSERIGDVPAPPPPERDYAGLSRPTTHIE